MQINIPKSCASKRKATRKTKFTTCLPFTLLSLSFESLLLHLPCTTLIWHSFSKMQNFNINYLRIFAINFNSTEFNATQLSWTQPSSKCNGTVLSACVCVCLCCWVRVISCSITWRRRCHSLPSSAHASLLDIVRQWYMYWQPHVHTYLNLQFIILFATHRIIMTLRQFDMLENINYDDT